MTGNERLAPWPDLSGGVAGERAVGLIGLSLVVGLVLWLSFARPTEARIDLQFAGASTGIATPTPSDGAMSIYLITNPNDAPLDVQHTVVADQDGSTYYFWSRIPPLSAVEVHTRDVSQLPDGFSGRVTLSAIQPFSAEITGFDYPQGQAPAPDSFRIFVPISVLGN